VSGLRDSKQLTPLARERLFDLIVERALGWCVSAVEPAEIDRISIQRASLSAMRAAVLGLAPLPDLVLVDAFRIPELWIPQRGIVHGDSRCAAIAAASIVAKVVRDRHMQEMHACDPRYGFDRHKGYGSPDHLAAIARFGLSAAHRRSFRMPTLFDQPDDGTADARSRNAPDRPILPD
jgi:ribonuclease HII